MNMIKKFFSVLAVFCLAVLLGFGVSIVMTDNPMTVKTDWNDSVGTVHHDFTYGSKPLNTFDLYLPSDKSKSAYGLVVYLHAGGFTGGDKRDDADILKFFTAKGYVSAGINYSLSNPSDKVSVLDMSNEIKQAMPQVIEQAKKLGYPIDRMMIAGGSAGHSLAMIYAYRDGKTAPVPVKMVFGMVGGANFDAKNWYAPNATPEEQAVWVAMMTGTQLTAEQVKNGEHHAVLKPINAADWIDEHSPPSLSAHGKLDKLVPFNAVIPLHQALQKYNVPHTALVFEHSGHGLHRDKAMQEKLWAELDNYLKLYMQ